MLELGNRKIGQEYPPLIVAELSANHHQSLEKALKIVDGCHEAGVQAIKLQTYTPDTMTLPLKKDSFMIRDSQSLWNGNSLYELYQKAYTPWEWHETIFRRCQELGLIFFSTPFDESAVDFLEKFDVPCYKIASFENNHWPLLKKVARTQKPVILSTGMAALSDLDESVRLLRFEGAKDIILLKCTSAYPSSPKESHILTIPHLKAMFNVEVGLSDHTIGIGVSLASIVLGARVIERHVKLSKNEDGVDSAFSIGLDEMKKLVEEGFRVWESLGQVFYGMTRSEKKSSIFRRSIYAIQDIQKGEILTSQNIGVIRPGDGLSPRYYEILLGRQCSCDIIRGTPMSWNMI